jgi:hypothetical protein
MTRDETVSKRIAEAGDLYRPLMRKAYAGDCSPRQAIKAQCLICVGYDRDSITHCSGYSCPLHSFRPYQKGEGAE